jgi:hypothetical protein
MYAENQLDSVFITFTDVTNWHNWNPKCGDTIAISEGAARTGLMYIHSIHPVRNTLQIHAMSAPSTSLESKSRAWERVTLNQLIKDIADVNGLGVEIYGIEDQEYLYLRQENQSDFEFLANRLKYESCAFLVFDNHVVAYSEPYIESLNPSVYIDVDEDAIYSYCDNSGHVASEAELVSGMYTGRFIIPEISGIRISNTSCAMATSGPESNRLAKGILRNHNKYLRTGSIRGSFVPDIAAGSVAALKNTVWRSRDGDVFIMQVRHEYIKRQTKIFFRGMLEGY